MFGWFYRRVGREVAAELRHTQADSLAALEEWERDLLMALNDVQRGLSSDLYHLRHQLLIDLDSVINGLRDELKQEQAIKAAMVKSLEATFTAKGRFEKAEESLHEITEQLMEREIARMNGVEAK